MAAVRVERPSVCPVDCADTCSLTVTVEDDQIVAIRGSHANPYTGGVLCAKVPEAYRAFVLGARHLRTALRRVGATVEERVARISSHGMLAGGSMDLRFFHKPGASLLDRRPLCGGIRTEAWVGTFGSVPGIRPEQIAHARLIIVWGNNVTWSNLNLVPLINRARKAGARLVVVDPRRTVIARRADLHIALRPGTDVVLAWAVAAELERRDGIDRAFVERHVEGFEEFMALARRWSVSEAARVCGVSEGDIRALAEWYHALAPVAISVGNGLERNQNGGSGIRAIFALPALGGKFGVPGGGLVNGASFAFPKTPRRLARPDPVPGRPRP